MILITVPTNTTLLSFQLPPFALDVDADRFQIPIKGCVDGGVGVGDGIADQASYDCFTEFSPPHLGEFKERHTAIMDRTRLHFGVVDDEALFIRVPALEQANPENAVISDNLSHVSFPLSSSLLLYVAQPHSIGH